MAPNAENEANRILADSDDADDYSIYSSGLESATTSLKSSVLNYQYENGRRYHAFREGAYYGPNDEAQNEHHHFSTLALHGELFLAPIGEHPQRILDIGTGTGLWAIDVADQFPSAQVIGNDLSPIQPSWIPPNLQFEIDDLESEWSTAQETFDFVHIRYMMACVSDWPALFRKAYRGLKPGGYLESQEPTLRIFCDDGSLDPESPMALWSKNMELAAGKFGKPGNIAHLTKGWMKDAGFVDVEERVLKFPIGPWPKDKELKEIGRYNLLSAMQGLDGFTLALFTRILGWTTEDVHDFIKKIKAQLFDKKTHGYMNFHVVYGRKPEEEGEDRKEKEKNRINIESSGREARDHGGRVEYPGTMDEL